MAPTPTSASATFTLFPIHTLFRFVAFSKVSVFSVILKWVFVFLLRNEFGRSSTRTHDGTKFAVTERPVKQVRREFCTETAETFIEEQKSRWGKCFEVSLMRADLTIQPLTFWMPCLVMID